MLQRYLYYSQVLSMQPDSAHEIHDVLCANAAANCGFETLLAYPTAQANWLNPATWIAPTRPQSPSVAMREFYSIDPALQVAPLPIPTLAGVKSRLLDANTWACKYYLPLHLKAETALVHTRNWNFVKACVGLNIPVVYERHYFQDQPFEPEIVQHPALQVTITQSPLTRQSLIDQGMPDQKAVWMHNGFSPSFLQRQPAAAQAWRDELLTGDRQHLVLYSGALYPFKGIDVLVQAAAQLPTVQFVLTGGTPEQVATYRDQAAALGATNVTLLGWIHPRDRLISLFQAADVLAHPHCSGQSADFTNPVKFFQYLAAGTAIAATDIAPLREFQSADLAITWCPPDDATQFAQCVQQALETYPRHAEGYAQNIHFAQQFTWENRIQAILTHVQPEVRSRLTRR